MDFSAIDFETATSSRSSACSVAVVDVKDNIIVDKYYTLLKPPGLKFNWFNIKIHGIHPDDVQDAPTFKDIWPDLRKHLEGHYVVAHNAVFDMSVLRAELRHAAISIPDIHYCCTVKMSQHAWPKLESHKLDVVGKYLNVDFKHHDALEDARACAAIPIAAGNLMNCQTIPELANKLGISICSLRKPAEHKHWHRRTINTQKGSTRKMINVPLGIERRK